MSLRMILHSWFVSTFGGGLWETKSKGKLIKYRDWVAIIFGVVHHAQPIYCVHGEPHMSPRLTVGYNI